ncbi:Beclin-1 [Hypsibius exemplaris]|uniref:Beclin-1 n=1 Tax=Hypsibius exemplaris TaxID=2072580 RepID=A0A1W0WV50_HYPEX|nr:Beclin-1 [Hypsibius exemplaris]
MSSPSPNPGAIMALADKTNRPNSSVKYQLVCCQRCAQMLDVETNFHQLEETILSELSAAESNRNPDGRPKSHRHSDQQPGGDIRERLRTAALEVRDEEDLALGRRQIVFSRDVAEEDGKHDRLRLMELLSDVSTVDHPICSSCTDSVMEELELEIQSVEKECVTYEYFLKQFKKNLTDGADAETVDLPSLQNELRELEEEERLLREQMKDAEGERQTLLIKEDFLKMEGEKMKRAEEEYFRERAQLDRELTELEDEQDSVNYQMRVSEMVLDKLKKTNIFNIAFHIWHQDQFGTINGFRLGRLPGSPVEWPEINAAWGQTVLLLYSLAKKMNFTFERYKLVPFGSHSYIECLDDQNKKLPLYGDGGFKFFWDSKFDHAMAAFLDCLHQFKGQVEKSDSGFCLPYDIEPGPARIRDVHSGASYCIRAQFNSVEQWTKALKWMLTNLKWGLAWVVSQFGEVSDQ